MKSFGTNAWILGPVLVLGTYNELGEPNAMVVSWLTQRLPKEIGFTLGQHASTNNLAINSDFTIAYANVPTMASTDFVGIVSSNDDPLKMKKTGWSSSKAPNVNAPIFDAFPMTYECRVREIIDLGEKGWYYYIAEVINILCKDEFVSILGRPDIKKMDLILFNPIDFQYMRIGEPIGRAYIEGKVLK